MRQVFRFFEVNCELEYRNDRFLKDELLSVGLCLKTRSTEFLGGARILQLCPQADDSKGNRIFVCIQSDMLDKMVGN